MNYFKLLLILQLLFKTTTLFAQEEYINHGPFVYSMECNEKVSYLLGTNHVAVTPKDLEPWIPALHYRASNHAYEHRNTLETPMSYNQSLLNFEKFNRGLIDNDTVSPCIDSLSGEEIEVLTSQGYKSSLCPIDVSSNFDESLFLIYILSRNTTIQLDIALHATSSALNKNIVYLEDDDIREQAELLLGDDDENLSLKKSSFWLENQGEYLKFFFSSLDETIEAYINGEILEEDFMSGSDEPDMIYRNNHWLPKILDLCEKGDSFISVGKLHLFGNKGLVNLLTDNGLKVRKMTAKDFPDYSYADRPYR